MKAIISILTLAFTCLLSQPNLHAQNADAEYVIVEYMKVKPGMWDKYLACEKVWKSIHQARVKAGHITGWELEEVVYPSGTGTEYDYLTITHLKNWKAIDDLSKYWDDEKVWAMLTKGLTAEQLELANNAYEYRDAVKREIWTGGDMVLAPGANPEYRVENFMKIPAGGWEDWTEMESKFVKPVHEKNIAMGNRAGWLMAFMVMPRGNDYAYQASTIDFYNTWEDMSKDEGKAWKEVYPDMTDDRIWKKIGSTRTLVKTEVRRLVDFVK